MTLYRCLYADPPWEEKGGGKIVRGANRHYPLMKAKDIMELDVAKLADPAGCHLYLWVTNGFLPVGLDVMKTWGFRYVTNITWAKDRFGIGQYFRGQTEQCLFGVMGNLPYKKTPEGKRVQGRTLVTAPRTDHSKKPPEMRQMIEKVSYGPFLELFAREKTPNWATWGNEIPCDVELKKKETVE
jgi:N6-adenosine-specific RNA methylase IME4